jgi:adenylyltransferase/sulfurtransferase
MIGTIMATETVKLLIGRGKPLIGRMLLYDAMSMKFRELKVSRDKSCPVCGDKPEITGLLDDYDRWYNEYWSDNGAACEVPVAAD